MPEYDDPPIFQRRPMRVPREVAKALTVLVTIPIYGAAAGLCLGLAISMVLLPIVTICKLFGI